MSHHRRQSAIQEELITISRIKYDVSDVEASDFKVAPAGLYRAKITQCLDAKPEGKDRRLELIYEIVGTDEKYGRIYDYVNLESEAAAFRLRALVDAVGLKPKGTLDTSKIEGEEIMLRVKHETWNDEVRAKAGSLLPADESGEDDEDEEDLEDDEDEEDEGEAYEEMPTAALRQECEERGLKKGGKKAQLVARLEADDEADDEDEEEEEATDGDEDEDDYSSWEISDLKEELKERGLKSAGKKSVLVARLEKDDESDDDPF